MRIDRMITYSSTRRKHGAQDRHSQGTTCVQTDQNDWDGFVRLVGTVPILNFLKPFVNGIEDISATFRSFAGMCVG
jgi:hypothetical protein